METALAYLKQTDNNLWLRDEDNQEFTRLAAQLYAQLTQSQQETPPKILLVEREPVRFLASFLAACAAGCPVFLGNPNWVESEWQQVLELVQPDIIWGQANEEITLTPHHAPLSTTHYSLLTTHYSLIMIPTGGSSGKLRFAIHTWETLMASVHGFQQYFQLDRVNSCCILPLYHVSGLMQFMRSLATGGKLIVLPFKQLITSGCDINPIEFFISLVPTQLQIFLQQPTLVEWLSQFQTVLLGGAPAWQELLEQARCYRIRLALTYGMTETASQIATLKPEDFLNGEASCGQVLPHAQITIYSSTGEILPANQIGNITIGAASLALGYYPELFSDRHSFQLDDLGFFDNRGCLNIIGRSSHKIITGGEKVFPEEVEAAIRSTQLVNDVGVIGIPDRYWGQAVTAIYVPSNSSVSTTALQAAIADKLSKFKQPKNWIPVQNLPRNSQGKINREQLLQIAIK